MSKLNDAIVHSSNLPFNGTMLECDGDELRPDGTCAKCERVNQRLAARLQCAFEWSADHLREAIRPLLRHIALKHPDMRRKVENAAMRVARRHNGMGYYDVRGEGWRKDRNKAWKTEMRIQALEEILRGMRP